MAKSTSTTPGCCAIIWLTRQEKERIQAFAREHPLEGYRRLTFMILDADVVACSPASVYRVLKNAGLLAGQAPKPPRKAQASCNL
jgi:putative transposase